MFALAHMMDFFAHELACLSGWGFSLPGIFMGSLYRLAFGHDEILLALQLENPSMRFKSKAGQSNVHCSEIKAEV